MLSPEQFDHFANAIHSRAAPLDMAFAKLFALAETVFLTEVSWRDMEDQIENGRIEAAVLSGFVDAVIEKFDLRHADYFILDPAVQLESDRDLARRVYVVALSLRAFPAVRPPARVKAQKRRRTIRA